jgi:hypothetical protein
VVLFGFEQRNDLRTAKYLWPFNVLVLLGIALRSVENQPFLGQIRSFLGKATKSFHSTLCGVDFKLCLCIDAWLATAQVLATVYYVRERHTRARFWSYFRVVESVSGNIY